MFDDQPTPSGALAPNNLPFGEPQDIFANTEGSSGSVPPLSSAEMPPLGGNALPPQTSALEAGILQPKVSNLPPSPGMSLPNQPNAGNGNSLGGIPMDNTIKEPRLSHGIMVTIMVVVVGFILIGSGWFVYRVFTKDTTEPEVSPLEDVPLENETPVTVPIITPPLEEVITPTSSSDAVDQEIILGESIDSDGDGVKDNREVEIGTNPSNWDTDNDELSDGEELLIWHTNPKSDDSDGDTYKDGTEVKAGYNPSGPGRLAEMAPVSATPGVSTSTTSSNTSTSSFVSTSPASSPTTSVNTTYEIEL